MRSLLALTISAFALGGCVTENSYSGSDKPVVENKINNIGAARTRIALALQYLNTGNNAQAKYNLERATEFAPELPEVHYSLAYYYQQVGENALADKAYQKALAIKPDDPNTLNNYGVFLCGIDEYDRATDQFLKAIEIPTYIRVAESYENLALCAIEFDDFDNAERYFKQAMNHSSQQTSTLISLAALYYAKSDLHKANELLKRYDDTGQVSSRALMLNYLIKNRMGSVEDAEKLAATITQTYPTSNEAYALREQNTQLTEFEILRKKYQEATLDELQKKSKDGQLDVNPKIKIIRKKKPIVNSATSLINNTERKNTQRNLEKNSPQNNIALALEQSNSKKTTSEGALSTATDTSAVMRALTTTSTGDVNATAHGAPTPVSTLVPSPTPALNPTPAPLPTPSTTQQSVVARPEVAVNYIAPKTQTAPLPAKTLNILDDDVKIVSFGETSAQSQPVSKKADTRYTNPKNNSNADVVFYETKKDTSVFANNRDSNNNTIYFKDNSGPNTSEPPMLNPKVPTLAVPFHIIQFGENLFSISVRYNVKLQKLLQWNGLKESNRVVNGSKVYLNNPNIYYEIKAGDSLYKIATQRHVLIDELMRWNKLTPDIELVPGHRLLLVDPDSYIL